MTRTSFVRPIRPRQPAASSSTLHGTGPVPAGRPGRTKAGGRVFRGRLWLLVLVALAVALVAFGTPARADHGDRAWVEHHAYELSHAARDAHRLSEAILRYPDPDEERLLERFHYFEDEAERFERHAVRYGDPYTVERAFRRLTEDYWELRAAFRHFHGSHRVRAAFHRINEPMEALYGFYVGGNLYRDDPRIRNRRPVRPKYGTPTPYDPGMEHRRPRADRRQDHRHDDRRDRRDRRRPGG